MKIVLVLLAAVAAITVVGTSVRNDPQAAFAASSAGHIVLMNVHGDVFKTLGRGTSPAFSRDGTRIGFVRDGDIWVMDRDGRGLARVTRTDSIEESPDWGPDDTLVYTSRRDGRVELWLQQPGGPAHRLSPGAEPWQDDRDPSWSPDGRTIVFASNRSDRSAHDLYAILPDGAGLRRLTQDGTAGMPSWRPNGRGLVFASRRDRHLELYALDLDSGKQSRLTRTPGSNELLPRIARDGRQVFVDMRLDGPSRLVIASAELKGRRVLAAGTSIDPAP